MDAVIGVLIYAPSIRVEALGLCSLQRGWTRQTTGLSHSPRADHVGTTRLSSLSSLPADLCSLSDSRACARRVVGDASPGTQSRQSSTDVECPPGSRNH